MVKGIKGEIHTACLPLKSAAEASHARLDWMRVAYLQRKIGMGQEREKKDVLLVAWIRVKDSFALKKHAHPKGFTT